MKSSFLLTLILSIMLIAYASSASIQNNEEVQIEKDPHRGKDPTIEEILKKLEKLENHRNIFSKKGTTKENEEECGDGYTCTMSGKYGVYGCAPYTPAVMLCCSKGQQGCPITNGSKVLMP